MLREQKLDSNSMHFACWLVATDPGAAEVVSNFMAAITCTPACSIIRKRWDSHARLCVLPNLRH